MSRIVKMLLIVAGALAPATIASPMVRAVDLSTTTTVAVEITTTTTAAETTTTTAAETTTTAAETTTTTTTPAQQASESQSGSLSITAPQTVTVSTAVPVGTAKLTTSLGSVTVSDTRGAVGGGWIARVTGSDFTTGGGSSAETISRTFVSYWSGPATSTSGIGTFSPGQATEAVAVALSATNTAFSAAAIAGNNGVSWVPTMVVDLPSSAVAGTYTGTITHSIA